MKENSIPISNPGASHEEAIEVAGTILLSIASFAVAWCSYQSTLWNGKQVFTLAESQLTSRRAQATLTMLAQQKEIDAAITINFVEAVLDNRQNRMEYYKRRARPQLASLLSAWLAMDPLHNKNAPAHPLTMKEYGLQSAGLTAAADSLNQRADLLWKEAQQHNITSDNYILHTVIFNLIMFFSAIAIKVKNIQMAQVCLLFSAGLLLATVLWLLVTLPISAIS